MTRRSGEETQRMIRAIAVLLRNTTWKCGRVERLVIKYLRDCLRKYGIPKTSIKDMLQYFKFHGKQKSEFFDALRRLEKRQIIRIEGSTR